MVISPFASFPYADAFWLTNTRIPLPLLDASVRHRSVIQALSAPPFSEALVPADIEIRAGKIAAIAPLGSANAALPQVDLAEGLVFPCFADLHTHLDKNHTWNRRPNLHGTFQDALNAMKADAPCWTPDDLYPRMEFSLRCAYAHGSRALRTHFDAFGDMTTTALKVLKDLKTVWRDRITLQTVSLVSLDYYLTPEGEATARQVAENHGILGGVVYPSPDLVAQLDRLFSLAAEYQLSVDLHVDESVNPKDQTLRQVAEAKLRHQFSRSVVCGHCCSLSVQTEADIQKTLEVVKQAEIGIVSLPMCNLYLQDRQPHRTPRYRGVTILNELKAQGIPVAIASDNCRDAFYAYGDMDGLEVLTQSVRIAHLDRPIGDWPRAITSTPADLMGLSDVGRIGVDLPADLVLFKARTFNELFARSQSDRAVLRRGRAIDTTPPDYAELDPLFEIH